MEHKAFYIFYHYVAPFIKGLNALTRQGASPLEVYFQILVVKPQSNTDSSVLLKEMNQLGELG